MSDIPRSLAVAPHVATLSVGYVTFAYTSVPTVVQERYGVSFVAIGLLMSVVLLGIGLIQIPGGRLLDRISTIEGLVWVSAVHGILAITLDFAPSFAVLIALRMLWGLASGLILLTGATHLARLYDGRAATRQQGIFGGMLTAGGTIALLVVPEVVAITGWVGLHAIGALIAGAAILLTLHGSRNEYARELAAGHGERRPVRELFSRPPIPESAIWLAGVCYVAIIGGYISLSTFISSLFADLGITKNLDAVVLFMSSVGRVGGGIVAEAFSTTDERMIVVSMGTASVAFVGLAILSGPALIVLPLVAMVAISSPFGAVFNLTSDIAADEKSGAALAIVIAMGNFAGLVFPTITGAIRDTTGSYASAFGLIAIVCVIGAVAGTFVSTHRIAE
jgi:nitrate/nitrite transporter NarK